MEAFAPIQILQSGRGIDNGNIEVIASIIMVACFTLTVMPVNHYRSFGERLLMLRRTVSDNVFHISRSRSAIYEKGSETINPKSLDCYALMKPSFCHLFRHFSVTMEPHYALKVAKYLLKNKRYYHHNANDRFGLKKANRFIAFVRWNVLG